MGERKHKAEGGEKKDKVSQNKKTRFHGIHPILQLQQLVGNKAVTNMIQRKEGTQDIMPDYEYNFWTYHLPTKKSVWLPTPAAKNELK